MPHVNLKIAAGQSDAAKHKLAEAFVASLVEIADADPGQISVVIEDVDPSRWTKDVYDREIEPKANVLYWRPGYSADELPR